MKEGIKINKLNNYHNQEFEKHCSICINVITPSYPFDWKCKFNNRSNAEVQWYGLCDKYEKNPIWNKK